MPPANLREHLDKPNTNMITCGGQATIPMVHAVSSVVPVAYAEIVASVASVSAGPGTRANIDEFTKTTSRGIETIGGADRGKAIIVLNPADPPMIMRDTIFCAIPEDADTDAIAESIHRREKEIQSYVPGTDCCRTHSSTRPASSTVVTPGSASSSRSRAPAISSRRMRATSTS